MLVMPFALRLPKAPPLNLICAQASMVSNVFLGSVQCFLYWNGQGQQVDQKSEERWQDQNLFWEEAVCLMVDNQCIAQIELVQCVFFCEFWQRGGISEDASVERPLRCCKTLPLGGCRFGAKWQSFWFCGWTCFQKWFVNLRIWATKFGFAPNSSAAWKKVPLQRMEGTWGRTQPSTCQVRASILSFIWIQFWPSWQVPGLPLGWTDAKPNSVDKEAFQAMFPETLSKSVYCPVCNILFCNHMILLQSNIDCWPDLQASKVPVVSLFAGVCGLDLGLSRR